MVRLLILVLIASLGARAQESPKEEPGEEEARIETEFVASSVFRSGTLIVRAWRQVHLETEYFGSPEFDVGITGVSWKARWKGLSVSPGFAVGFGGNIDTAPIVTLRWTLDTERWFSQGFLAQSLTGHLIQGEGEAGEGEIPLRTIHSSILDNNHVSIRLGPIEAGGMWERIQYREELEWKGGLRLAARLGRRFKLIFQTVAPDIEFRGGIAYEH
jgi:hypothetical protein